MGGFSGGGDAQLNKFFQQVQEIREHIENIEQNTKRIEALYTASLGAAMEDQVTRTPPFYLLSLSLSLMSSLFWSRSFLAGGNREAENLVFDTNKIATTVKNKLRGIGSGFLLHSLVWNLIASRVSSLLPFFAAMKTEIQQYDKEDEENKGGVSVEGRLRASQHSALSKKFVDIMAEYQDVQAKCKTKFKQRMERQYRIGNFHFNSSTPHGNLPHLTSPHLTSPPLMQSNPTPPRSRWTRRWRATRLAVRSSRHSSSPRARGPRPRRP